MKLDPCVDEVKISLRALEGSFCDLMVHFTVPRDPGFIDYVNFSTFWLLGCLDALVFIQDASIL